MSDDVKLPDWLTEIEYPKGDPSSVRLIVATERGSFDVLLEAEAGLSANAIIAMQFLNGSGTLIDVGANIGSIALPVAKTGSNTVAIEMMPENIEKLTFGALSNKLGNIRIFQAAASDADTIINYQGAEAWGSISETGSQAAAFKLDTILALLGLNDAEFLQDPVFLKIDVEGHEAQVIEGSSALIEKHRPFILFEAIDYPDAGNGAMAAKEIASRSNYKLFFLHYNVLVPYTADQIQAQLVADFLAVPEEKLAFMGDLLPNYQIRELRASEDEQILAELMGGGELHRRHAQKILNSRDMGPAANNDDRAVRLEVE